jgi:MFS family permease
MFMSGMGMSQIAPVLPLYIKHLGVESPAAVAQLSGLAFGITYIVSAVFSPIWGSAADKYGRKPMLIRASLGMSVIIGLMGLAPNVHVLIGLRVLLGVVSGYATACTTMIATQADKDHIGFALGTLSTSNITGSLFGPSIGGLIGDFLGYRYVFLTTGSLLFLSFLTTVLFVREEFTRQDKKIAALGKIWRSVPEKGLTLTLFLTFFMVSAGMFSVQPVLTVYINQLSGHGGYVALVSGLVFSASGLANILAAPSLGKLGDRIGTHKVLLFALIFAGVMFIPQAFVTSAWQLMGLRFLLGLSMGGLNPSINSLLKKITPDELTGRIYGLNMSANYFGVFWGSVLGGQIAGWLGVRYVFLLTGFLLLLNAGWVYWRVFRAIERRKGNPSAEMPPC